MAKTRDLVKKIRDIKGIFHAKMGAIKDRNDMDLTEAENIKKNGKSTQKNYTKKDPNGPDNHDDVVTHLEPDMLEYKVKWALENITRNRGSGGDGNPAELLKILKDKAVEVLHSMYQKI